MEKKPKFNLVKGSIALIVFSIILIILIIIIHSINAKTPENQILTSNDNSFSITIPGSILFETKDSDTLDLFSATDEMAISTTVIEQQNDTALYDIVALEMSTLSNTKKELADLSELEKIELKDYEAYKYSYTYFDEVYDDHFFAEIAWIKKDNKIYVLDCEVVTKNQDTYISNFNKIIYSFKAIE